MASKAINAYYSGVYVDTAGVRHQVHLSDAEVNTVFERAAKDIKLSRSYTLAAAGRLSGLAITASQTKSLQHAYDKEWQKYAATKVINQLRSHPQSAADALNAVLPKPKTKNTQNSAPDSRSNASIVNQLADARRGTAWNLPPHNWSLPLTANRLSHSSNLDSSMDSERRGRIFYYYTNPLQTNVVAVGTNNSSPQVSKAGSKANYQFKKQPVDNSAARRYGFQFIWNPETYAVQTALQQDMTPSTGDAFVRGQAMFPGTSSVQFSIRLDRVNDFACLAQDYNSYIGTIPASAYSTYESYYKAAYPQGADLNWKDRKTPDKHRVDWLMNFGTMADLEYLYRAINDINTVSKQLRGGFLSADVGYLGFSLVGVELGPMYYVGYLTGISVNHTMFTENYIPIRTDVTINMNVMAQASPTSATLATGAGN